MSYHLILFLISRWMDNDDDDDDSRWGMRDLGYKSSFTKSSVKSKPRREDPPPSYSIEPIEGPHKHVSSVIQSSKSREAVDRSAQQVIMYKWDVLESFSLRQRKSGGVTLDKFSSSNAISSDMLFTNRDRSEVTISAISWMYQMLEEWNSCQLCSWVWCDTCLLLWQVDRDNRMRNLEGRTAISSSDVFGGENSSSPTGYYNMPDVGNFKDGVRSVAGKMSSVVSGIASTIQVHDRHIFIYSSSQCPNFELWHGIMAFRIWHSIKFTDVCVTTWWLVKLLIAIPRKLGLRPEDSSLNTQICLSHFLPIRLEICVFVLHSLGSIKLKWCGKDHGKYTQLPRK